MHTGGRASNHVVTIPFCSIERVTIARLRRERVLATSKIMWQVCIPLVEARIYFCSSIRASTCQDPTLLIEWHFCSIHCCFVRKRAWLEGHRSPICCSYFFFWYMSHLERRRDIVPLFDWVRIELVTIKSVSACSSILLLRHYGRCHQGMLRCFLFLCHLLLIDLIVVDDFTNKAIVLILLYCDTAYKRRSKRSMLNLLWTIQTGAAQCANYLRWWPNGLISAGCFGFFCLRF